MDPTYELTIWRRLAISSLPYWFIWCKYYGRQKKRTLYKNGNTDFYPPVSATVMPIFVIML